MAALAFASRSRFSQYSTLLPLTSVLGAGAAAAPRDAVAAAAVLADFRAPHSGDAGRFSRANGASLAQMAAARLLQSSAAREAGGGEGQRDADLEAAADAARDLVLIRPSGASAAAAPAAAAAAKAREEFKWHNIF